MERLSLEELNDIFLALLLHTKSSRQEQAVWKKDRIKIWEKLVFFTAASPNSDIEFRTNLLENETELRKLWKSPEMMERVFTRVKDTKLKTKVASGR
jgi:hypothetical protein